MNHLDKSKVQTKQNDDGDDKKINPIRVRHRDGRKFVISFFRFVEDNDVIVLSLEF